MFHIMLQNYWDFSHYYNGNTWKIFHLNKLLG
jgi:hypothetical protein